MPRSERPRGPSPVRGMFRVDRPTMLTSRADQQLPHQPEQRQEEQRKKNSVKKNKRDETR